MLDGDVNSPKGRIAGLVNDMLKERSLRAAASPDDDLPSLGLGSLDMANLVLAVESEFDVCIPDADITPVWFRSVSSIAELVETLLPGFQAAM